MLSPRFKWCWSKVRHPKFMLFDGLCAEIINEEEHSFPLVQFTFASSERKTERNLPEECGICPRIMNKWKLEDHLKTHLRPDGKRYKCIDCDEDFITRTSAAGHARIHRRFLPYVCVPCNTNFYTKHELKLHEHTCTLAKEYVCEQCDKRFALSCSLKQHLQSVHKQQRLYGCRECTKKYFRKYSLIEHKRKFHSYVKGQNECPFCGLFFDSFQKFSQHLNLIESNDIGVSCLSPQTFIQQIYKTPQDDAQNQQVDDPTQQVRVHPRQDVVPLTSMGLKLVYARFRIIHLEHSKAHAKITESENDNRMHYKIKRSDIVVAGLPQNLENLKTTVIRLCSIFGLAVGNRDIQKVFYIHKKELVLVKFVHVYIRDKLMEEYKKKRSLTLNDINKSGIKTRVYLRDNLTPLAARINFVCRQLLKKKIIKKFRFRNTKDPEVSIIYANGKETSLGLKGCIEELLPMIDN